MESQGSGVSWLLEIGDPGSAWAEEQGCRVNPLEFIMGPCHWIVATKGIGGFAGSISAKKRLLEIEKGDEALLTRD